ncbi:MAG: AraC family transcriptional regulator [Cytophagales bacterium]|nr:AraC family transcriptional regulator [Cytophagales bacterium]
MPEGYTLNKGNYTGKIFHSADLEGCITTITHYPVDEDEGGWHCHENPHIDFVFQGGDVERRKNIAYQRKTGDIDYYEAGEFHETVLRNDYSKSLILELDDKFLNKYDLDSIDLATSVKNNVDAKLLSIRMVYELLNYDCCSRASLLSMSLSLVSHTDRCDYVSTPRWVQIVSDLLNDRWNEQITLDELSMIADVHPVTISKHFRKYFSCTLGNYMRKLKIANGITLIKDTNVTLTDIALKCGFSDQSHFTRNFKQFTGVLPKDFRKF